MTALRTTGWLLLVATLTSSFVAACGEDGQSMGSGQCPEVPLYVWKPPPDPKKNPDAWTRVKPDGTPLTKAELDAIAQAEGQTLTGGRCLTPAGSATTLGQTTKPPTGSGGGGSSDAGNG